MRHDARARPRAQRDFCQIAGYLGEGERFDTALTEFAEAYADQVERDHALLEKAVRAGRIAVEHVAQRGSSIAITSSTSHRRLRRRPYGESGCGVQFFSDTLNPGEPS